MTTVPPETKKCIGCEQVLPVDAFAWRTPLYRESRCRPCRNEQQRLWRERRPELVAEYAKRQRSQQLAKLYGLSKDRYREIAASQQQRCAICRKRLDDVKVCVDHDHESGLVRGILCHNCNVALGLFGESWRTVAAASRYLRKPPWKATDVPMELLLPPAGGKGWANRRKTHCPKGHRYDAENTVIRNGGRKCRTCERDNSYNSWRARHPDAPVRGRRGKRRAN